MSDVEMTGSPELDIEALAVDAINSFEETIGVIASAAATEGTVSLSRIGRFARLEQGVNPRLREEYSATTEMIIKAVIAKAYHHGRKAEAMSAAEVDV